MFADDEIEHKPDDIKNEEERPKLEEKKEVDDDILGISLGDQSATGTTTVVVNENSLPKTTRNDTIARGEVEKKLINRLCAALGISHLPQW